jgi:hypothetical protein
MLDRDNAKRASGGSHKTAKNCSGREGDFGLSFANEAAERLD